MFEASFKDYLKEITHISNSEWNYEAGMVLLGAKEIYEATGVAEYLELIEECMKKYVPEDGSLINLDEKSQDIYKIGFGKILCFLYEKTENKKYKIVLDSLVNHIRGMEDKYEALPLYLEYETKFNEKENYNDIYKYMKNARSCFQDVNLSFGCRIYDLLALIDMYENSSEEVFEQHKQYSIWFKEALKGILPYQQEDIKEVAVIAYCILKGCRLGILLQEKYQHIGEEMVCKLQNLDFAEMKATGGAGVAALAYAEYLRRSEVL